MIIDAKDLIVGRFATRVAKLALLGEDIKIINCDKAVLSGNKRSVYAKYDRIFKMGTWHAGPFMPRVSDRFVRRIIRGMLPYKQPKGRDAYKRIMCYIGVPAEFKDQEAITFEKANKSSLKRVGSVTVAEVCKLMGG
jgi:large subunit ribosomal protein L13